MTTLVDAKTSGAIWFTFENIARLYAERKQAQGFIVTMFERYGRHHVIWWQSSQAAH